MRTVLAIFISLLLLSSVSALPVEVIYGGKVYPVGIAYLEGKIYVTAFMDGSPLLLAFSHDGTLEEAARYSLNGSFLAVRPLNGTLLLGGDLGEKPLLMRVLPNRSVLWARTYNLTGRVYDIATGGGIKALLGNGRDIFELELDQNGSVREAWRFSVHDAALGYPHFVENDTVYAKLLKAWRTYALIFHFTNGSVEWARLYPLNRESCCIPGAIIVNSTIVFTLNATGQPSRAFELPKVKPSRKAFLLIDDNVSLFYFGEMRGRHIVRLREGGVIYAVGMAGGLFFLATPVDNIYPMETLYAKPVNASLVPKNATMEVLSVSLSSSPVNVSLTPIHLKLEETIRWFRIRVRSEPANASLIIDGETIGRTPLTLYIRSGRHEVVLKKSGYVTLRKDFNIEGSINLTLGLYPPNGTLIIIPNVPSVFWLDGKRIGFIRGNANINVPPGEHSVMLTRDGYSPFEENTTVGPNESTTVNAELHPLPGRLAIDSTPGNLTALVTGNGILRKCTTPCELELPPGSYLVNVTENGVCNATWVTLGPNMTATVEVSLPKKPSPNWLPIVGIMALLAIGGGYVLWRLKTTPIISEPETIEEKSVEIKAGKAFGISHVGARDNNEDNLLVIKLPDAHLLAVADGLGGHSAGEVASQMAVDTLREIFEQEYREGMGDEDVKKLLERTHKKAHGRIKENATGEREGMGTTLVSAFVRNGKVIVANTGDSRAYLIRNGKIAARTKDHSLVQELLDKGEITAEEARRHPMRNIITKALGIAPDVDFYEWGLEKGDTLLLSSDGLHDYIDEGRIAEIVSQGKSAEEIAKGLIDEALPMTKDNVTVVVLKL